MSGKATFITLDGKLVEKEFHGNCEADVEARANSYAYNVFRQYKVLKVEF